MTHSQAHTRIAWALTVVVNVILLLVVFVWGLASLAKDGLAIIGIGLWCIWGVPVTCVGIGTLKSLGHRESAPELQDDFPIVPWALLVCTGVFWYLFITME
jgi:hypothetical protein